MMATVSSLKHLRWACRRGMLELDLLLIPFFDEQFTNLTVSRQQDFERLLQIQDSLLYEWFMGTQLPEDPDLCALILMIKNYVKNRSGA